MALGSHVCKNNWADLPAQANNIHSPIKFKMVVLVSLLITLKTTEKSNEWKFIKIINIAKTKPMSPILFTTIACIAAFPANIRVVQKLINK